MGKKKKKANFGTTPKLRIVSNRLAFPAAKNITNNIIQTTKPRELNKFENIKLTNNNHKTT